MSQNQFLVSPKECKLRLQLDDDFTLQFGPGNSPHTLKESDLCTPLDILRYPIIDLKELYENSDILEFSIKNGPYSLDLAIEGDREKETISIPLLFETNRFNKLFDDSATQYQGTYNRKKKKVVLENRELSLVAKRQSIISWEAKFVDEAQYAIGSQDFQIDELEHIAPDIYEAYNAYLLYFRKNKTLPSLAMWDKELRNIAEVLVNTYLSFLEDIPRNRPIPQEVKKIIALGTCEIEKESQQDNEYYLSPFSPLIISYLLFLINEIGVSA